MDALKSHADDCEYNPSKLPTWMVTSDNNPSQQEEPTEGTTSLRMRLFKNGRSKLLNSATTGGLNIFSMDAPRNATQTIQSMEEITRGIVKSSDVIERNSIPADLSTSSVIEFIDSSDDERFSIHLV